MMEIVILSLILMLLVVLIMSVGVLAGRKPISGSCGGLSAIGIDGKCEICGATPEEQCKSEEVAANKEKKAFDESLAYDASEGSRTS